MVKIFARQRQGKRMKRYGPAMSELRSATAPSLAGDFLPHVLEALGGGAQRVRLCALWQNWGFVMGPELAPLAQPLGQHKGILLIGAEDSMLLQELQMLSAEILERANAFMDEKFFSSVRLSLIMGKTVLDRGAAPARTPARLGAARPPGDGLPPLEGRFLSRMDADSPVARCYARFVRNGD